MKTNILKAISMLALFLMAGCASTPNTVSSVDPTVDMGQYKTYGFTEILDTDGKQYQSMETGILMTATSRELEARGFSKSDQPDVVINFSIESQEKVRSRSVPTGNIGMMGYDPFYGDIYGAGWGMSHQTRIDQYTEGKLNIDVVDKQARKVVWQGSTKGRLTKKDYENAQATLEGAVTEIFHLFPAR